MDSCSAELTKYASNALLAARISYMNEISLIAESVGANIDHIRKGVGLDTRIGSKYLYPGPGFGGSCFGKDLNALKYTAMNHDSHHDITDSVLKVNERQKHVVSLKIKSWLDSRSVNGTIGIWGLAFKADTDDVRDSPALTLIEDLLSMDYKVIVHDPQAMDNAKRIFGDRIRYAKDKYDAISRVEVLALMTEWREYRNPNFKFIAEKNPSIILIDGRNIWDETEIKAAGLFYDRIGKASNSRPVINYKFLD
jgi:UDPglucose 6-dehydrogenase